MTMLTLAPVLPTRRKTKPMRVLDFDIEVRPITYLGSDFTTGQVTAIASAWIVDGVATSMRCWQLTQDKASHEDMLLRFVERFYQADMVTGHFIRGYDLPVLNGALMRVGCEPLSDKLSHDTKNDLTKRKYVSASQESIADMLGVVSEKRTMSQHDWWLANTLQPEGLRLTKERVTTDILQHVEMRERLLDLGWLGTPKTWRSNGSGTGVYVP